jgi:hypothetical protein
MGGAGGGVCKQKPKEGRGGEGGGEGGKLHPLLFSRVRLRAVPLCLFDGGTLAVKLVETLLSLWEDETSEVEG